MAGSVTVVKNVIFNNNERIEEYLYNFTADASDGSVPNTDTDDIVTGWVVTGETDPGTPAPTAAYDVAVNDNRGADVFGGEMSNRAAATTERVMPKIGNAYGENFVNSVLTLAITNNSVNSAKGQVRILVRKGTT